MHGLSLEQKLKQRSSWIELKSRGILLDDPTTTKSESLNQAKRHLHKRKSSLKLEKMLINRPKPEQLANTNILKDLPPEISGSMTPHKSGQNGKIAPLDIKMDNGIDFETKFKQRASWKEIKDRGILLDDPTSKASHSLQAAKRQSHKRKASLTLDKFLNNRPTPNQLHHDNIIDTNTAHLFFGADPIETQVVTPQSDDPLTVSNLGGIGIGGIGGLGDDNDFGFDYDEMEKGATSLFRASGSLPNQDVIYKDNLMTDKENNIRKLDRKLRQRPSIDETMARGILLDRTDTKLSHSLQAAKKQLHKRKASISIDKMLTKRPDPKELEEKGILIPNKNMKEKKKKLHQRKASQDLEAGLKRRMSLSEMQGLGLLFQPNGIHFDPTPEDSDDDVDHFMDDEERNNNIAGLFKQAPRTSKPLQQTDFSGIELDNRFDINADKRRGSLEIKEDDMSGEFKASTEFEPFKLSKKQRISRIGEKLAQRPSVEDMKMRGLIYEHPSISKSLVERKKNLMKRRASNKVDSMLQSRPNRRELENRNILLKEDETLDKRKRHKRKRSQNLENAIQRRPKLMEEKEAQRQRRRSMTDRDFKPDWMQNILNDEEETDYERELQQVDIRFLNVGGYVIPLVSPKFMSDLVGDDDNGNNFDQKEREEMEEKIETLEDKIEDLELQLKQEKNKVKQKDQRISSLKGENTSLKQKTSRQSLIDLSNSISPDLLNTINNNQEAIEEKNELEKLRKEIEGKNQYIDKLSFYLKEEYDDIDIPTPKQLKKRMKKRLNNNFRQRPSVTDLQNKAILSSNFITDATNQDIQIAEKKLKFRRTSQLIDEFLTQRPSKDRLIEQNHKLFQISKEYQADVEDYEDFLSEHRDSHIPSEILYNNMEDSTKEQLRMEVVRLNAMLAEKVLKNNKLETENEALRFKIQENLNNDSETLGRGLKEHSIYETQFLDSIFENQSKEADEKKHINELERENNKKSEQIEKLQQKIRRLSTFDGGNTTDIDTSDPRTESEQISEMKRFVDWSRTLSWPDIIKQMYESGNDNYFLLMQRVIMESQRIQREEYNKLQEEGENKNRQNLFEIDNLKKKINELKRAHKSSVDFGANGNLAFTNPEAAIHALQDPAANKISVLEKQLEKQKREHLKDKEKFVISTMEELNRLRAEIKEVGAAQEFAMREKERRRQLQQQQQQNSYYSYLSGATSYIWGTKK